MVWYAKESFQWADKIDDKENIFKFYTPNFCLSEPSTITCSYLTNYDLCLAMLSL